jgi:uncharacterized protein (TIGR00369 family)
MTVVPPPDVRPRNPNYQDRVRSSFARQGFMRLLGARISRLTPGFCELEVPYRQELSQQHGYFHGGVAATLADVAGGYAAFSLMDATSAVLTVEFKLNLIVAAEGDHLVARGTTLKSGRTLTVCRSEVVSLKEGQETLCASALGTFMALAGKADG